MILDKLVQYDDSVVKVDPGSGDRADGQRFTIKDAVNKYMMFGSAPWGGRTEHMGLIHAEPFAYIFGCATVIDSSPHDPMASHRALELHDGDRVFVKNYGFHRIEIEKSGLNRGHARLVKEEA